MWVILAINLMVEKGGLTAFDRFYCQTLNPLNLARLGGWGNLRISPLLTRLLITSIQEFLCDVCCEASAEKILKVLCWALQRNVDTNMISAKY